MSNRQPHCLTVYVSDNCPSCRSTPETVAAVRAALPGLRVEVVNVGAAAEKIPDFVFSVPTYALDGCTVSLGNPSAAFIERLFTVLRSDAE